MSSPLESALNAAQLARRVWVERRATGRQAVVYWLSQVAYPPGFLGFNVYRSPQPTDDMTSPSLVLLTPEPVAVPFFLDTIDPHAIPSYVVTAVDGSGEEPIDRPVQVGDTSDPNHQGRRFPILSMPRIFAEFRRRKNILLDLNGELVTVLVRRLYGKRCKKCFDGPYETASKSSCDSCFGSSWERGYEIVPSVQCRISSIKEALQLQPPAIMFKSNPTGWLVGFPLLRNGDVIVRPLEGKRYEVQTLSLTVHQGILTGQDFDLIAFEPYHPIFNFPVV